MACPIYKTKVVVPHGHHDLCTYIGGSGSVLSHIGGLVEDLSNRRMGEDLVAELIERHALGDRQTADGDYLGTAERMKRYFPWRNKAENSDLCR